jgi:Protein of unknown function (DUF433)
MPTQRNEVITKALDILGGTPVFRGARVPFQALLDYLEGGQTLEANRSSCAGTHEVTGRQPAVMKLLLLQ